MCAEEVLYCLYKAHAWNKFGVTVKTKKPESRTLRLFDVWSPPQCGTLLFVHPPMPLEEGG